MFINFISEKEVIFLFNPGYQGFCNITAYMNFLSFFMNFILQAVSGVGIPFKPDLFYDSSTYK